MRFLVDECTGSRVAAWLRIQGHEVFSVFDDARGMSDDAIIAKAYIEQWILITNDKDFGEQVYSEGRPHHGIVLLRLRTDEPEQKIERLKVLLLDHSDQLAEQFIVVTKKRIRFSHS